MPTISLSMFFVTGCICLPEREVRFKPIINFDSRNASLGSYKPLTLWANEIADRYPCIVLAKYPLRAREVRNEMMV